MDRRIGNTEGLGTPEEQKKRGARRRNEVHRPPNCRSFFNSKSCTLTLTDIAYGVQGHLVSPIPLRASATLPAWWGPASAQGAAGGAACKANTGCRGGVPAAAAARAGRCRPRGQARQGVDTCGGPGCHPCAGCHSAETRCGCGCGSAVCSTRPGGALHELGFQIHRCRLPRPHWPPPHLSLLRLRSWPLPPSLCLSQSLPPALSLLRSRPRSLSPSLEEGWAHRVSCCAARTSCSCSCCRQQAGVGQTEMLGAVQPSLSSRKPSAVHKNN